MKGIPWTFILLAAALAAAGCGDDTTATDDGGGEMPDGEVEAEPDVGPDGDADAPLDEPEAEEAGGDADADADLPGEAEAEVGADGDADDGGPVGAPVGAPCAEAGDCLDGVVPAECLGSWIRIPFPDGYCSAMGCLSDADCPGGAAAAFCAVDEGDGPALCLDRCTEGLDDCREGYNCMDLDDTGPAPFVCVPFCADVSDCAPGETCVGEPPLCYPTAGGETNGGACVEITDCVLGSFCLAEDSVMSGWPGGLCTQECLEDAQCTNGGVCVLSCEDDNDTPGDDCDDDGTAGLDEDGVQGLCVEECVASEPGACPRPGWTCQEVGENLDGTREACTPDCGEAGGGCTTPGFECDPAAGGYGSGGFGRGRCQAEFDETQLGDPCSITGGCTGGACLAEAFSGFPHGICVEECRSGPGGDPCPGTAQCLGPPGETGACFALCSPGDTCREGYECRALGGMIWVCWPACDSNEQCEFACCSSERAGFCDPSHTTCL
jgi:hypothetical protein